MRLAAVVEYAGSRYAGWQHQDHAPSIQQALEAALSKVADAPVDVVGAGRTDAGVHALGQVVHFDSDAARPAHGWRMGANVHLPEDIALQWVGEVPADFHARYDAIDRSYRYLILNRANRSAPAAGRVTLERRPLDAEAMHRAAQALVGEHDFSAYRAAGCQARHANREIHRIAVRRRGELVLVDVCGNAFLHNMVRIIVGNLLTVGSGERGEDFPGEVLAARDRRLGATTARPEGLYFLGPRYAPETGLPARVESGPVLPLL